MADRSENTPVIRKKDGSVFKLSRLPLSERLLQEDWLQNLIEQSPEIIPVIGVRHYIHINLSSSYSHITLLSIP